MATVFVAQETTGLSRLVVLKLIAPSLLMSIDQKEAEAMLQRCLRPPWGSHSVRAHAHLRLAGVATRRGDHERALRESQRAILLFEEEHPRQVQFLQVARYQEVRAQVSTGRLADARCRAERPLLRPAGTPGHLHACLRDEA